MRIALKPERLVRMALALLLLPALGCSEDDNPTGAGGGPSNLPKLVPVVQGPVANPANGHVYYRLANSNWTDAEATAIHAFGGHLVTIDDAAENIWVRNVFANAGGSGRVWIGLNDARSEGNFEYADGTALGFTQWESGEPNNSGDEDYVLMYSGNGNWVDVKDLANPPGIGQVYGVVEVEAALPAYIVQGPVENPANGHTYYRLNNTSWTVAEDFAHDMLGAHLVTIDDADENDFVQINFANTIGTSGRVWLGLTDAGTEGTFVWEDGTALGFTQWEPGEPNNSGDEDYVAMYANNGNWVDVKDLANPPFIGPIYGVIEVR